MPKTPKGRPARPTPASRNGQVGPEIDGQKDPLHRVPALVHHRAIAKKMGITVRTLRNWVYQGCWPEPYMCAGTYMFWRVRDVEYRLTRGTWPAYARLKWRGRPDTGSDDELDEPAPPGVAPEPGAAMVMSQAELDALMKAKEEERDRPQSQPPAPNPSALPNAQRRKPKPPAYRHPPLAERIEILTRAAIIRHRGDGGKDDETIRREVVATMVKALSARDDYDRKKKGYLSIVHRVVDEALAD